ncbi:MAG: TonB-dependent receptor [Pseudomonadota bacterium]
MTIYCYRKQLPAALALALGLASGSAVAQLEEVVVTAQKRAEPLQDTPLSVAAFSAEQLENQRIESLTDLAIQSPSLAAYDFPTSTSNISLFLRGFGNTDSQTLTIDNPVGLYIDGVYIARTSGATLDVLDLERVEILRGPQGTLFGRNSSAGAINMITRKPGAEFGGEVEAGLGNYNAWYVGGSVDVPLGDSVRTKISGRVSERDGWVENKGPNNVPVQNTEDYYQRASEGVRFALSWDIDDNFVLDYAYDYTSEDHTPPYYQFTTRSREEDTRNILTQSPFRFVLPEGETEHSGHNLSFAWSISDNLELKSITGYREMEETTTQNWSSTLFFATGLDWETEAFSQEFQLLGNAFNDKLDYIVGLYYFEEEGEKAEEQWTNFAGPVPQLDALALPLSAVSVTQGGNNLGIHTVETDLESQAIFAQGTYTPEFLDSRMSITAGIRYTEDERSAVRGVDPGNPSIQFMPGANDLDYDRTDYTLVLDYAFTDDVTVYGRVATGYRAGGSGERTLDFALTFDEEEAISYELGLKSEWLDNRLRVNAAVFMTDYDDLILTISGQPPTFASYVENVNAGEAEFEGVELDIIGQLGANGTITLNYAYLDWELNDVVVPQESFLLSGPPASATDLRGTDISSSTFIPFAPEHSFNLAFDYSFEMGGGSSIDLHLNYNYRDELFSQPGMGLPVDELGLLNGRIAWSGISFGDSQFTIAAWGKNLTDEEEVVYNLAGAGFQFNEPTMYGVDISMDF